MFSHKRFKTTKGFTIIELSLALTFLSVMLITIALLTIHILTTYQKGLAIKAVNSTGRELVDDFSRAIAASSSVDATKFCSGTAGYSVDSNAYKQCVNDSAHKFIHQQYYNNVGNLTNVPTSGAFCTGRYTYLYNTGYTMNDAIYSGGSAYRTTYDGRDFRLLKISDPTREICRSQMSSASYALEVQHPTNLRYQSVSSTTPEELLGSAEDNLALFSLAIFKPTQHALTQHYFYSGTFILATVQGGVDITSTGDYCTDPPDNLNTDFAYCAINKFNFAMRATGETNQ